MTTITARTRRAVHRPVVLGTLLAVVLVPVLILAWFARQTAGEIRHHERRVEAEAARHPSPTHDAQAIGRLPEPVRRYLEFAIVEPARFSVVELAQSGRFRRPGSETFNDTTARQVVATGTPALLFDATTPILPGIWARAYDAYADGQMTMKAKILSALTVVDERESEASTLIRTDPLFAHGVDPVS